MGKLGKEPSMDDILSSIKRIISEEVADENSAPPPDHSDASGKGTKEGEASSPISSEVLELTDEISGEKPMTVQSGSVDVPISRQAQPASDLPQSGDRASYDMNILSAMLIRQEGSENTIEGLIRSILTPFIGEWLEARLPAIVEDMVAKEIARITQ